MKQMFGTAKYEGQQLAAATVVRNAYADIPANDLAVAEQAISRVRSALFRCKATAICRTGKAGLRCIDCIAEFFAFGRKPASGLRVFYVGF